MILILPKDHFNRVLKEKNITDNNVEKKDNVAFISISDTIESPSYFKKNYQNVLVLYFDDIIEEVENLKMFSDEQAANVITFIQLHKDKKFIIHCEAGISRSGAVGTFINEKYKKMSNEDFKKTNPYLAPNQFVYNKLEKFWK